MKTICILVATVLICAGCATPEKVQALRGQGLKRTFPADQPTVWKSALNACRHGELSVVKVDPRSGYIAAKTGVRMESWGEYVGVWVTSVATNQTEVEVVSKHAGPTGLWSYTWERQILNDIALDFGLELLPPERSISDSRPPKAK